jgi:DnaJ-class molecular chaperone
MVTKTLYDVLEVSEGASGDEIKSAFRRLAKKHHPDVAEGDRELAEEAFKKISTAYDVLSNPAKRSMYDQSLKYGGFKVQSQPMYEWVCLTYLDDYGWFPLHEREWNEHHDVMYKVG